MRRSLRLQPLEFPDCWREQAIALIDGFERNGDFTGYVGCNVHLRGVAVALLFARHDQIASTGRSRTVCALPASIWTLPLNAASSSSPRMLTGTVRTTSLPEESRRFWLQLPSIVSVLPECGRAAVRHSWLPTVSATVTRRFFGIQEITWIC